MDTFENVARAISNFIEDYAQPWDIDANVYEETLETMRNDPNKVADFIGWLAEGEDDDVRYEALVLRDRLRSVVLMRNVKLIEFICS